jgi:hypothetical protein
MRQSSAVLLAAGLLGALLPSLARADRLDRKLNDEMPAIVKQLKAQGYKNVGVLRFRVQKGKRPARFDNAPLNGNLAVRLENMLVIHGGPREAESLGIIHDAAANAARQKVGSWYTDQAERRKLFDREYRLAWGNKTVKPDVFLTGLVRTSPDLKKTTVEIISFDAKVPARQKMVCQFTIDTDRSLVRDLGYSFNLGRQQRKSLLVKRDGADVDKFVVDAVQQGEGKDDPDQKKDDPDDKKKDDPDQKKKDDPDQKKDDPDQKKDDPKQKPDPTDPVKPANVAGIEVKMLADGKDQEIRQSATQGDGPRWQVECPPQGKPIAISLKNTTDKRVGVVLRLNGISTIDQQTDAAEGCRKWVMAPGATYNIRGFYMFGAAQKGGDDDKDQKPAGKPTLLPFKVLVGDEAKVMKAQLGDKYGLIEVDVFAEGAVKNEDLQVSAKGLPPSKDRPARASYKALRTALLKNAKLKTTTVAKREVIVPDKEAAGDAGSIKVVEFAGYSVGHLVVKILPKEDKPSD